MKKTLLFALLTAATSAYGIPAKRMTRTVTQPDGTTLELTLRGDECLHYHTAPDGTVMALDEETGWWRPSEIPTSAREKAQSRRAFANSRRSSRMKANAKRIGNSYTGEKRGLVILAQFADKKFSLSNPKELFTDIFNKEGYSDYGMGGSVRDYFRDQSYGKLTIDFDVVGPVTASRNMSYYGANDSYGDDLRPAVFVGEAIKAASSLVDFSKYDWDGDGEVDQVYVIYAGYGEAQSDHANEIWPHEWDLTSAGYGALRYNGVKINTYACSNELHGKIGKKVDGIGTACHEFSHCLGLPDMYDTEGESFGMDQWDLMDYGSYGADGYVPVSYTAYERWYAGWTEPVVLDEGCIVTGMKNIDEDGECYVVYNNANKKEYYMLQNIQQTGWNSSAAASGMLIFHVDYDATAWYYNTVNNNAKHQRMSPVCADNSQSHWDLEGDLWPYKTKNSFTDSSAPAAKLFNANINGSKYLNRPITNIVHKNGLVSFRFNGGDVPVAIAAPGEDDSNMQPAYDMQGRAITSPRHGQMYIQGGRVKIGK